MCNSSNLWPSFNRRVAFSVLTWLMICSMAGVLAARAEPQPVSVGQLPANDEASPDASEQPPAVSGPVDFFVDIAPILTRHCIKCHGPQKRSGGLRLDSRDFAEAGGDSGKPIVGGTRQTNELLARVSSSDRSYRMPKNAARLSDQEIERFRQWVDEGTPWSVMAGETRKGSDKPFYEDWLLWVGQLADRYKVEFDYARPYAFAFVAVQLALLVIARSKTAYNRRRAWATGKAAWFCKFCGETTSRELVLVWLLSVAVAALVLMRGHDQRLAADLATSQSLLARVESPWSKTIYGSPPVPIRPDHPKQLGGTYYRGNCERNPELFNGGNYLTAIFHVNLSGSGHEAVQVGSSVPAGGLYVQMELERAAGTTDALFSKELMASVFLSAEFLEGNSAKLEKQPVRLETLEEAKRWVAYFPIGSPDAAGKLAGLIYVYTGRIEAEMVRGDPHYGIKYDLAFADGKLTADSDLWMNSFGNSAVALPDPPGKIPYREWFDYRPIPSIEGENSKDPKLLGVDEYVKKGLIKPTTSPSNAEPGKKEPSQGDE